MNSHLKYLEIASERFISNESYICVALCHNEINILPDFLDHYRSLGNVSFLVVDDNSDDGSTEFLMAQSDVSVFRPVNGSTYKQHKRYWRKELLDAYGVGRWCIVPDIDEHLVYLGMETKTLAQYLAELDSEGCEAVHGIMVDMYSDDILSEHLFQGGKLINKFPYFDGPESYWVMSSPKSFNKKFPSPSAMVYGGMRERVIFGRSFTSRLIRFVLPKLSPLPFDSNPNRCKRMIFNVSRILYRLFSENPKTPPLDCTKIPLIKWRAGYYFNGGAHCINKPLSFSKQSLALLHYRFTKGMPGLQYMAKRGQFAADDWYCKKTEEVALDNKSSVRTKKTRTFENSASLRGLI